MKKLFLLITFVMLAICASAQKLKPAFDDYNAGNYEAALKAFKSASMDKKDPVAASLGIGMVYGNKNYSRFKFSTALQYLQKANQAYAKLQDKEKKFYQQKYGITAQSITDEIDNVVANIFKTVELKNTVEAYNTFATKYKKISPKYSEISSRHAQDLLEAIRKAEDAEELACWNAISANPRDMRKTVDAIAAYIAKYSKSRYYAVRANGLDSIKIAVMPLMMDCKDFRVVTDFVRIFPETGKDARMYWASGCTDVKYTSLAVRFYQDAVNKVANGKVQMVDGFDIEAKMDSLRMAIVEYALESGEPTDLPRNSIWQLNPSQKALAEKIDNSYMDVLFYRPRDGKPFDKASLWYVRNTERFSKDFTLPSYRPDYDSYIRSMAPTELGYVALLRMVRNDIEKGNYQNVAKTINKYKPLFPKHKERIEKTLALLSGNAPRLLNMRKLPGCINDTSVGTPVISADMKTFYYSVCRDEPYACGIYVCDYDNGGYNNIYRLQDSAYLSGYNVAPMCLSPDGSNLLYFNNGDPYMVNLFDDVRDGKSIRDILPMYYVASAKYTFDGNAIVFCGNCDYNNYGNIGISHDNSIYSIFHGAGSRGGDIFVVEKDADGNWGKPINLGPVINTRYCEFAPMLAADMKTLYFSSDGHYGLGHADVYMSRRLSDDSWTEWSEPVNLGRYINTPGHDSGFIIASDGKTGFMYRGDGIYSFELPDDFKADEVSTISGKIVDGDGNVIKSTISWEDLSDGRLIGTLQNNPVTGEFFITLPQGKNYGYVIESEGYFPVSGNIDTRGGVKPVTLSDNFVMVSADEILDKGLSMVLNNIFFDFGKYNLRKESHNELKRLVNFVRATEGSMLVISGHTDNVGSEQANEKLSLDRAGAVRDYLVSIGLSENSITIEGKGSQQPIADNKTEAGRAKNRRVEFRIVR